MATDRSEYPAMLAALQPHQAIDVLNDRVRLVWRLNVDIADWLSERRRLEEQYSAGLRKLAKRQPPGDSAELGVFSVPWTTLTSALNTLAESHHVLAARIETDVERPLREFAGTNREMQAMSTIQGNLAAMARDIENAQRKNEKLKDKGRSSAGANQDLDNAQSQWDSQAPYVFETLQAVDETRLNHLRDVLTQYQTHEVDQVEKARVTSEQCLNVLLNVETADEIKTFAIKNSEPQVRQRIPTRPSVGPSQPAASPATPRTVPDDRASQRSDSFSEAPQQKSDKMKGLKRLGTVLGRRRENKQSGRLSESPERKSPDRAKRQSTFGSFSNRLGGRSSRDVVPTLGSTQEEPRGRPHSPLRTVLTHDEVAETPPADTTELPAVNGGAFSNPPALAATNGNHHNELAQLQEPLQPSAPFAQEPSRGFEQDSVRPLGQVPTRQDSEGYSTRPAALDPISQAEQEAAFEGNQPQYNVAIRNAPAVQEAGDADAFQHVANTLKMQAPPPTSRRAGTVRGRRSMYSGPGQGGQESLAEESLYSPAPIAEESSSQLQTRGIPDELRPLSTSPWSATGLAPTPGSPTFATSASAFSPFAPVGSSIFRPSSRVNMADDQDNQSIRSGRSLGSTTSQSNKHPDLHLPGLNSSIVETVSAWFEQGQLTRSVVIGELALAYNPMDFSTSSGIETIRLDNFSLLEKVAPNPVFITPAAGVDAAAGQYSLNLAHVARTSVAFKYQLQTAPGALAPLLVTVAWKIEPAQASAILSYTLNPAFDLQQGGQTTSSLTLANVALVLHLDGARAASCLSKPVGSFSAAKNAIFWQLGDVVLAPGVVGQKLLARFMTGEETAKGGRIEARWDAAGVGSGLGVSMRSEAEGEAAAAADPFADEDATALAGGGVGANGGAGGGGGGAWKEVQGVRKLVSGTYSST